MKNKTKYSVEKHRLGGWCVSIDGKLLNSIFRLKSDAIKHKGNLKRVAEAVNKKYLDALNERYEKLK